jgi:hypothetical protein
MNLFRRINIKTRCHLAREVLLFLVVAILVSGCMGDRYQGGKAPSGSPEERHKWGVKKLGNTYLKGAKWVKNSDIVQHDVGKIVSVTPIGNSPCSCAFGDGCSCWLSLEVIGTRGTGHFEMGAAFVDMLTRRLHFFMGTWTFNDRKTRIHPTGVTEAAYYASINFIKTLNREIKRTPKHRPLYFKRSHVRYALGDRSGALEDITYAIKLLNEQTTCARRDRQKKRLEPKWCPSEDDLRMYRRTLALLKLEQGLAKEAYDLMQKVVESSRADEREDEVLLTWIVLKYSGESGELLLRHSIRPEMKEMYSSISAATDIFLGKMSPDSCDSSSKPKAFKFHLAHAHYFRGDLNAAKECASASLASQPINYDTLPLRDLHNTLALRILLNRINRDLTKK